MIFYKHYSNQADHFLPSFKDAVYERKYWFSGKTSLNDLGEFSPRFESHDSAAWAREEAARERISSDSKLLEAARKSLGDMPAADEVMQEIFFREARRKAGNEDYSAYQRQFQWQFVASNVGVFCVTHRWDSPVMWALYSNSHYGACMRYRVDRKSVPKNINPYKLPYFTKVTYSGEQPLHCSLPVWEAELRFELESWSPLRKPDAKDLLLSTKLDDFSFEQEYRAISRKKNCHVPIPYLIPEAVIFGAYATQEIYDQVEDLNLGLPFYKMYLDNKSGKLSCSPSKRAEWLNYGYSDLPSIDDELGYD